MEKNNVPEKKDHGFLGKKLGYFIQSPEVGAGLPLLTPKGAKLKQILKRFVEDEEEKRGYQAVETPVMAKSDLYRISGHWELYRDGMFSFKDDEEELALRPMSCPFQFMLYKSEKHSYRDLPVRYSETASLFRKEASGAMHGLARMRQFTLSDGHIICRPDQVEAVFFEALDLINYIAGAIGLENVWYRLSLHDPENLSKYIDNPQAWKESEERLRILLEKSGLKYVEKKGEAAFYGPKVDFQMKNVFGKEDTVITLQLDFALAERFGLSYIDENGEEKTPLIIHRSSIGCYERTIAFLLEQYQGRLPFWFSPEQVIIIPVSEKYENYANEVLNRLKPASIRVSVDKRSFSVSKRISEAQKMLVPLMVVIGDKEIGNSTLSVRKLDGESRVFAIEEFVEFAQKLVSEKKQEIKF